MKNKKKLISKSRKDSAEIVEELPPKLVQAIREIKRLLKKKAKGSAGDR